MPPSRFLVVEYPGTGLPLADWTKAHPGSVVDMILQPMRQDGKSLRIPGTILARGMDAAAVRALRDLLDDAYAPHETLRTDVRRGEWLGRITIHVDRLVKSPPARAVALQQHRLGAPWSHVDEGVVHMRLRVPEGEDAEAIAEELRRTLADDGSEAQVNVQDVSAHDYSVWEDLVQASIGMRT